MKTVNTNAPTGGMDQITTIVADDSPTFLHGFCHFLRTEPYTCVVGTAGNGFEAIELVRRNRPKLVVMDYHMPGLRGDLAGEWITERFPETKVLIVSSDEHAVNAQSTSADHYAFMCKRDLMSEFVPLLSRWFPPVKNQLEGSPKLP